MVHEKVLLYGMTLVADRPATLASVGTDSARQVAREMFIRVGACGGRLARPARLRGAQPGASAGTTLTMETLMSKT